MGRARPVPRSDARHRRGLRNPWLWTWLQPVAVLTVILAGGMAAGDRYPAGEPKETALLVWLSAVTVPGLVAQVVDSVRRSRRTPPGQRSEYQELMQTVQPQPSAPVLRPSSPADAAARIFRWFLLVSALDLGLALTLTPVPVDEGWRTLALFPLMPAMGLMLVVLLAAIGVLAVLVIRLAVSGDRAHPFVPAGSLREGEPLPLVFRAMMLALGICLVGAAAVCVPSAVVTWGADVELPHHAGPFWVGAFAASADGGDLVWLWALRITVAMILGGLAGVIVLSPIAFRRMVLLPRRRAASASGGVEVEVEVDRPTRGRRT